MITSAVTGQRSQLQTNTYSWRCRRGSASQNPALPPAVSGGDGDQHQHRAADGHAERDQLRSATTCAIP